MAPFWWHMGDWLLHFGSLWVSFLASTRRLQTLLVLDPKPNTSKGEKRLDHVWMERTRLWSLIVAYICPQRWYTFLLPNILPLSLSILPTPKFSSGVSTDIAHISGAGHDDWDRVRSSKCLKKPGQDETLGMSVGVEPTLARYDSWKKLEERAQDTLT